MVERPRARCIAHTQEARSNGVDVFGVEFVKVAAVIDQDGTLEGFFSDRVIADTVVGEIVENFEGEEIAWYGDVSVPRKDGAVDYFDVVGVASRRRRTCELGGL